MISLISQPSSGFGSSAASGGGFADFDDFDNKVGSKLSVRWDRW